MTNPRLTYICKKSPKNWLQALNNYFVEVSLYCSQFKIREFLELFFSIFRSINYSQIAQIADTLVIFAQIANTPVIFTQIANISIILAGK